MFKVGDWITVVKNMSNLKEMNRFCGRTVKITGIKPGFIQTRIASNTLYHAEWTIEWSAEEVRPATKKEIFKVISEKV